MSNRILISVVILYASWDYVQPYGLKSLEGNKRWDMFVLNQRWPSTVCKYNTARDKSSHCQFPNNKQMWTVGGVYPTRIGSYEPSKCNLSWPFNPDEVQSIVKDLNEHWTNIKQDTNPYRYWDYQWVNHGTCSTDLEIVNTPLKYFQTGLDLHNKYLIYEILSAGSIVPDDKRELTVEEIRDATVAKLGKQAFSHCEDVEDVQYLRELYICFDKQLKLIDCEGMEEIRGTKTNCDVARPIIYPTISGEDEV